MSHRSRRLMCRVLYRVGNLLLLVQHPRLHVLGVEASGRLVDVQRRVDGRGHAVEEGGGIPCTTWRVTKPFR